MELQRYGAVTKKRIKVLRHKAKTDVGKGECSDETSR